MALTIQRKNDQRVIKCILHRTADIPGGVTVSVANLGGKGLFEGTPLAKGSDGLYEVVKTAQVITDATASDTSYEVAKGSHFVVGDYFATADCNGQKITAIDKTDSAKDVITVDTTLGAAITAGTTAFESDESSTDLAKTPCCIAGSNEDVVADSNTFVSAWVIGVVREETAPAVTDAIKDALKCIVYV